MQTNPVERIGIALYYDFRYRRGDNTLLVHILKSVTAWLWKRNARIYNKYGYSIVKIEKERGTMDGKPENKKYFLMNYKIYRNRLQPTVFRTISTTWQAART